MNNRVSIILVSIFNHFQMVRDVSYAVGCGTALCKDVKGRSYKNAHVFVCNYGDGYLFHSLTHMVIWV